MLEVQRKNMKRMRNIGAKSLIFALLCFTSWESYQRFAITLSIQEPLGQKLIEIPRRDAKRLEAFFRHVFAWDGIVFTLTGSKPFSLAAHGIGIADCGYEPTQLIQHLYSRRRFKIGWETWEKYNHLFKNDRLIFWEENHRLKDRFMCLCLADKVHLSQIIKEHEMEFSAILQQDKIDPEQFIQKCLDQDIIEDVLKGNHALLGIMLGYGRENAWFFQHQQGKKLTKPNPCVWTPEELKKIYRGHLGQKNTLFQQYEMEDVLVPMFVGYPDSEESKELKRKYIAAKEALDRFYEGKNFLEATLSLFRCGPAILLNLPVGFLKAKNDGGSKARSDEAQKKQSHIKRRIAGGEMSRRKKTNEKSKKTADQP
jgi:hypothetical protein